MIEKKEIQSTMNKKIYIALIVLILIFAIIIRIWNWPNTIGDINCDEAMSAINAKSIAENGTDIYGTTYPIYFEGWLYSGQSAFAIYAIAFFIKIFGFSTISIRLPILLISISSLFFILLLINRVFKNKTMSLIVLSLLAINPWDILQSQWCLDCNFYPHIMLIAVYLLYRGIEDKKTIELYISMIMFAITLYAYGIALYLTPTFLLIVAIYLLMKKKITIKKLLLCIMLFLLVALPIILMTIVNLFNLSTISIGKLTIQNFSYVTREDDMLFFSDNIIATLLNNINCLIDVLLYQVDGLPWNAFSGFGTIYLISLPIIIVEIIFMCYEFFTKEERYNRFGIVLILTWLLIGLVCGIVINSVNINRINIIWYVLVIINGIGIYEMVRVLKYKRVLSILFILLYSINFLGFINYYHTAGNKEIVNSFTWSKGLVEAIQYVENSSQDKVILSNKVSNTDKKDIFIRYGTEVGQKEQNISKEEFFKYYIRDEKPDLNFSTGEKEYVISEIVDNTFLTEPIYIITKEEESNIANIDNYQKEIFNNYIVLIEK